MSRTKISEYSATAADNTDINAINIAEGCAPSGINNAIREMMKQLKDFQAGTAGDSLSVGGNLSYTGTLTGSTGILNIGSGQIYKDASGNVGVGTGSPQVRLHVVAGDGATNTRLAGASYAVRVQSIASIGASIEATNNTEATYQPLLVGGSQIQFTTSGSERARIDSTGKLLVGTTTTFSTGGANLTTVADAGFAYGLNIKNLSSSNTIFAVFTNSSDQQAGSISQTGSTTVSYNTSSDYRLKENITDAPSASDSIDAIQIRSFDWKADGSHQKYGVIAQELEAIAPEAVSRGEKEDDMWGVDYSKLVPMMVKAIQELKAEIAILKGN
jgi:hypothetical protein